MCHLQEVLRKSVIQQEHHCFGGVVVLGMNLDSRSYLVAGQEVLELLARRVKCGWIMQQLLYITLEQKITQSFALNHCKCYT